MTTTREVYGYTRGRTLFKYSAHRRANQASAATLAFPEVDGDPRGVDSLVLYRTKMDRFSEASRCTSLWARAGRR